MSLRFLTILSGAVEAVFGISALIMPGAVIGTLLQVEGDVPAVTTGRLFSVLQRFPWGWRRGPQPSRTHHAHETIKAVTIDPAWQTHRDTIIGSLDVGKYDLIYIRAIFPPPAPRPAIRPI